MLVQNNDKNIYTFFKISATISLWSNVHNRSEAGFWRAAIFFQKDFWLFRVAYNLLDVGL